MANPADRLSELSFDAVQLRTAVTQLVERERLERQVLGELVRAVDELLAFAPPGSAAHRMAMRLLEQPLVRARTLAGPLPARELRCAS